MEIDFVMEHEALVNGIIAHINDDARWLIYADWLIENERDAEATAIQHFLPQIRTAVAEGYPFQTVLETAAKNGADQQWFKRFPIIPPEVKPAFAPINYENYPMPYQGALMRSLAWHLLLLTGCLFVMLSLLGPVQEAAARARQEFNAVNSTPKTVPATVRPTIQSGLPTIVQPTSSTNLQ